MSTTKARARPAVANPDAEIADIRPRTSQTKLNQLMKLGIRSGRDLLWHIPRYYEDRSEITPIGDATEGIRQTFRGTVSTVSTRQNGPRNMQSATLYERADRSGARLQLMWFGQRHLVNQIEAGDELLVCGTVNWSHGPMLRQPDTDVVRNRAGEHRPIHNGFVAPTYSLTAGMTQGFMRTTIPEILETCRPELERVRPQGAVGDRTLYDALLGVHRPLDEHEALECLEVLARDELLTMQIALLQNRREREDATIAEGLEIRREIADDILNGLPFELTGAQVRAITDVREDLSTDGPTMNRLIQGDVGSGKTVIALTAAVDVATAGGQTALLAPTELLAEQHFASISAMIGGNRATITGSFASHTMIPGLARPFCTALLTGSTRAKDKKQIQTLLKQGAIDLVIGTHAIIQGQIDIPNLTLAVADEQHRFGVEQRAVLRQTAHYLMLTATAIPRTMQLALFRDLDVSTIDEAPKGRIPIRTEVLAEHDRRVAYSKIREEVNEGRQAFIVYPLIEESESLNVKAATEEIDYLRNSPFAGMKVGLIHGRMKPKERENELRAFKDGELDILATTAVIEVGIDIPNASVMLIESAERFGIAQLHQFRGRIGRGAHASTCYVMITPGHDPAPATRRRLVAIRDNTDGMRLAEIDLAIRGQGDIAGARQSGESNLLKAAAGYTMRMLEEERERAEAIYATDRDLRRPGNRGLKQAVRAMRDKMETAATDH